MPRYRKHYYPKRHAVPVREIPTPAKDDRSPYGSWFWSIASFVGIAFAKALIQHAINDAVHSYHETDAPFPLSEEDFELIDRAGNPVEPLEPEYYDYPGGIFDDDY